MQPEAPTCRPREPTNGRLLGEVGGACGDLGTFIPHVVGAMTVAGLAPAGVLFGFGAAFVTSGLFYGLPMALQPMKAISAVLLTGQLAPGAVAAAGLVVGAVLLLLGATGLIGKMARLIPQSVTAGLQLGLGLTMGWLGLTMVLQEPWIGVPALALLLWLPSLSPFLPAAPLVLLAAVVAGITTGHTAMPTAIGLDLRSPLLVLPGGWGEVLQALELAVVPQLPLTLTNAVIVTAAVCRDLFPERAARASVRNLALTSGAANLLLALGFSSSAAALFAAIPASAVGALLLVAGADLAVSKRLFDARPHCWPAIGLAAGATALVNPAVGLAAGWAVELGRTLGGRLARRDAPGRMP